MQPVISMAQPSPAAPLTAAPSTGWMVVGGTPTSTTLPVARMGVSQTAAWYSTATAICMALPSTAEWHTTAAARSIPAAVSSFRSPRNRDFFSAARPASGIGCRPFLPLTDRHITLYLASRTRAHGPSDNRRVSRRRRIPGLFPPTAIAPKRRSAKTLELPAQDLPHLLAWR